MGALVLSRRMFFFFSSRSTTPSSNSGQMTASTKWWEISWEISSAVGMSQFLLRQMTHPKAERGSTLYAVVKAS